MADLHRSLTFYLQHSLAQSTIRTYLSGARRFIHFCADNGLTPFPPTEHVLCVFMVFLARSNLCYRTLKVYLHGVQHHSLMHGYPIQFSNMRFLYYTLRGIRRVQGDVSTRPVRAPITISHLWSMLGFLSASSFTPFNKAMWRAVILTAFFGLLRVSEFTCPAHNFDPVRHLSPSDVSFNSASSMMYINIKASKTDPFRSGIIVRLAAIPGNRLCPVAAMKYYLSFRTLSSGPLFIFNQGSFLTRNFVVAFIQISLPYIANLNTHSFRIGGASAALSAGASDSLIRIMGRWSSDCFRRYLRIQDNSITKFIADMSTANTSKIWNPDDH